MQPRIDLSFFRGNRQAWIVITGLVVLVYLLNFSTPFRLTNDTVRYFALLEDRQGSWPAAFGKRQDFLPLGYVYFLQLLSAIGILTPWGIAFFQLLYLGGSLYLTRQLFGAAINGWLLVLLTLINWTTVKLVLTPLSELQFLFFSIATLYAYQRFTQTKKLVQLGLTIVFGLICYLTRTAGIVLIAALLVSYLTAHRRAVASWLRLRPLTALTMVLVLVSGFVLLVTRPKFITYLGYFWRPLAKDGGRFFTNNIRLHLMDWAELFIDTPYSKVATLIAPPVAGILYLLTGLFFLVLLIWCLIKHRALIPLPVSVYLLFYLGLIFNWPFFEARFFFPILPLAAAILLLHFSTAPRGQRRAGLVFLGGYMLMGIFVLLYYSRLSLDKAFMMKRHDAGIWQKEYRYLFSGDAVNDSSRVNQQALYILRKYN